MYTPLYRVQGTRALEQTSEHASDASYASWRKERDEMPSGARTGEDGARARRARVRHGEGALSDWV